MLARSAAGLRPAAAGLPWAAWRRGLAVEAQGFSSPGNTGISEEMKEVGCPDVVRANEEAVQRHHFSEKERFNQERFENPERTDSPAGKAFTQPGDTGPARAVTEASGQTLPGQSLGINIIPEKLAHTKADPNMPEAPLDIPGANPWEVRPDNQAGEMGPGRGELRGELGANQPTGQGERSSEGGAAAGTAGRRPEDAGAEGESEEDLPELHQGKEWAS